MATNRLKRPRDPVSLAKLVGDIATGQAEDAVEDRRDESAVIRGHIGGLIGGDARAKKLTPEKRKEIAQKAAKTRGA